MLNYYNIFSGIIASSLFFTVIQIIEDSICLKAFLLRDYARFFHSRQGGWGGGVMYWPFCQKQTNAGCWFEKDLANEKPTDVRFRFRFRFCYKSLPIYFAYIAYRYNLSDHYYFKDYCFITLLYFDWKYFILYKKME